MSIGHCPTTLTHDLQYLYHIIFKLFFGSTLINFYAKRVNKKSRRYFRTMRRIKFDIYLVCKFAIFPKEFLWDAGSCVSFINGRELAGSIVSVTGTIIIPTTPLAGSTHWVLPSTQYPLGTTQYDHNYESMISTGFPSGMELSRINLWCIIALQILNNLKPLQMLLFPFV